MVSWGLFADVIWQLNQARTAATQGQIMTPPVLTDTRQSQSSKLSCVRDGNEMAKKVPAGFDF